MIVSEQKAGISGVKTLLGVAQPATSDLEQVIDKWIELMEYQTGAINLTMSKKAADMKKERAIVKVLRVLQNHYHRNEIFRQ